MNLFAILAGATRSVFPLAARPRLWFPFILLCLVQVFLLGLLVSFHNPLILPLTLPLLKSTGGEGMTHYPFFFYGLPAVFMRVNIFLAIVLETLTSAVATVLFASAFSGGSHREAWAKAARRYPVLLVIGAVVVGLSIALSSLGPLVPPELFATNPAVRWGTRGGMMVANSILQALFAFTTAWVVLKGRGPLSAVSGSFSVALQAFLPTFLVILFASALFFPFDYLAGRPDLLVEKLRPEVMTWLLGLRALAQVLIGFFLTGAITYIFVWKKGGMA